MAGYMDARERDRYAQGLCTAPVPPAEPRSIRERLSTLVVALAEANSVMDAVETALWGPEQNKAASPPAMPAPSADDSLREIWNEAERLRARIAVLAGRL